MEGHHFALLENTGSTKKM